MSKIWVNGPLLRPRLRSFAQHDFCWLACVHRKAHTSPKTGITSSPKEPLAKVTVRHGQRRHSAHSPLGSTSKAIRKKVTIPTLNAMHKRREPITVITAHDFPSAHVADDAGMDIVLVGDSLAMVALGMQDTSEVTVDDMLLHCKSVCRGAQSSFTVRSCL